MSKREPRNLPAGEFGNQTTEGHTPDNLDDDVEKALKLHEEIFDLLDEIETIDDNREFFYRDKNPQAMIRDLLRQVRQKEEHLRTRAEG